MSGSRITGLLSTKKDTQGDLVRLLGQLDGLLERLDDAETAWSEWIEATTPDYRASASR